jgi:hypothetical protein
MHRIAQRRKDPAEQQQCPLGARHYPNASAFAIGTSSEVRKFSFDNRGRTNKIEEGTKKDMHSVLHLFCSLVNFPD